VTYANTWVSNVAGSNLQNPEYADYGVTDCTNYVSQALRAGGYDWQGWGLDRSNYNNWYSISADKGRTSFAWSVAADLLQMLYYDVPGGYARGWTSDHANNSVVNALPGDVIFYDWGLGEGVSHVGIVIKTNATDPVSGFVGTLVNTHSTDHKKAFYGLQPYDADMTRFEKLTVVHVGATN
jgi:cell wall-associated NlpC family hydrolase